LANVTCSIYPTIDPRPHYAAQTFKGKVVLITGASRGIGLETSLQYARSGASLVLVARKQETLNLTLDTVLREVPGAEVLTFPADVRDAKRAEEVVTATVSRFGKLDILVANAGLMRAVDKRGSRRDQVINTIDAHLLSIRIQRPLDLVGCFRSQRSRRL